MCVRRLLLFLVLIATPVMAQYPNPGIVNPDSYSFVAENTGDLTVYFLGSNASYVSQLGLLINGVETGYLTPESNVSSYGDSVLWPVTAGDILVFVLHVLNTGRHYYSDETMNEDGQHIYSAPFPADDTIPAGIYIGFEDQPLMTSDLDYSDVAYIFVEASALPPDPPPTLFYQGSIDLAWDHSVSENIVNYRLYYGHASGVYDTYKEYGYINQITVTDLEFGRYYFAVTAVDAEGNESGYSNEVPIELIEQGCQKSDINCDGSINVLDQQLLVNCILGKIECP